MKPLQLRFLCQQYIGHAKPVCVGKAGKDGHTSSHRHSSKLCRPRQVHDASEGTRIVHLIIIALVGGLWCWRLYWLLPLPAQAGEQHPQHLLSIFPCHVLRRCKTVKAWHMICGLCTVALSFCNPQHHFHLHKSCAATDE